MADRALAKVARSADVNGVDARLDRVGAEARECTSVTRNAVRFRRGSVPTRPKEFSTSRSILQ